MQRRSFLALSSVTALASLSNLANADTTNRVAHSRRSRGKVQFGIGTKLDKKLALATYSRAKLAGPGAAEVPYVYLFYDEHSSKFVNPLSVTPTLDASKNYVLTSTLHSFNIKSADLAKFKNLQNNLQLSFNAAAPNPVGELTWIFMNALNVLGQANQNNPTLTTLGGATGTQLSSQPTVTVTKGLLTLQVLAYGQKQKGLWQEFVDAVASVLGNPTTTATLSGFGVPALALDAVKFVDQSLQAIEQSENLVPLWQTGSMDFGLDVHTSERFKMCPGLWCIIDHDYWLSSDALQGHTVDLSGETFAVLDGNKKVADANSLITDLKFAETS